MPDFSISDSLGNPVDISSVKWTSASSLYNYLKSEALHLAVVPDYLKVKDKPLTQAAPKPGMANASRVVTHTRPTPSTRKLCTSGSPSKREACPVSGISRVRTNTGLTVSAAPDPVKTAPAKHPPGGVMRAIPNV